METEIVFFVLEGNGCFVEQREGWKMAFVLPPKF